MRSKRVLLVMVCFLFSILHIACNESITVKVGEAVAPPGKRVELPVTVSSLKGQGIIAVDLNLEYDPAALSLSSLTNKGTIIQDWFAPTYKDTKGQVRIILYNVKPVEGQGVLLRLVFDTNAAYKGGKTSVVLKKAIFNGGKISPTLKNGSIKILSPSQ